ncbi:MAG: UDP-N-acetylglucosamine 1-carboxyvinyltransferase [Alphaproteobacteria bacterium]|nr:UDP-N-acetylglucosamine 1-carboxyvinyltransferase [Alphaproteobacteria bacterium]
MDRIRIQGGKPLAGAIPISGAKNAALPLMAACLLSDKALRLSNMPHVADIASMASLLAQCGVDVHMDGDAATGCPQGSVLTLCARQVTSTEAPYDLVRKMRASVLVLGPLLARCGEARVSLPGGCAIGTRPIDLHLKALAHMGAEITLDAGYVTARAPKGGLVGARFAFPSVSVGATENALMAAVLAKGETVLANAAREPEIGDLARCLAAMGARIDGIGTDTLTVHGVESLNAASHAVIPDRIEAGTYAIAAAITDGDLTLQGVKRELVAALCEHLEGAGVAVTETPAGLRVHRHNGALVGIDVMTEPFPGFPTDLQAQMMTLLTVAKGAAMVTETIFENRFMHVPELCRMGANINIHGASAMVRGVPQLRGAPVMATDLRASVSLVLAGLAAQGETTISRVYHLDRGYERLEEKLQACGARIERLKG